MKRLIEKAKVDAGIKPQSASSAVTGEYYNMDKFREVLVTVTIGGTLADAGTVDLELLQAEDGDGTNSKALNDVDGSAIKNTITSVDDVNEAQIVVDTAATGDSVDINGVTFTSASSEDKSANEFDGSGTTANEATSLKDVINDEFDTLQATVSSSTVTITSAEPGETTITVENVASNFTANTTIAVAYVDAKGALLDTANDFNHIAAKVTPSASCNISAEVIRYNARYKPPNQAVAAGSTE